MGDGGAMGGGTAAQTAAQAQWMVAALIVLSPNRKLEQNVIDE
jgi:hypothetical protein